MSDDLAELEKALGYQFHDRALLTCALTHPSYAAEQEQPPPDNQRLEFLGDAVLQLAMSAALFAQFPDMDEGKLTKIRSALANERALVERARVLELSTYVRLGKGEERTGGRARRSVLADAMEAVLGAVFLDGGFDAARAVCVRTAAAALADVDRLLAAENPKGALQELTQERYQSTPTYEVLEVSGPEHRPRFNVRVVIDGEEVGAATAGSRKNAEKRAAQRALERLQTHAFKNENELEAAPHALE